MKRKTMISVLYLIAITTLYFSGFCEVDIWVYLLGVIAIVVYMFLFVEQQKKIDTLDEMSS